MKRSLCIFLLLLSSCYYENKDNYNCIHSGCISTGGMGIRFSGIKEGEVLDATTTTKIVHSQKCIDYNLPKE